MAQAVDRYFDELARRYDGLALRAHPCYEEMLAQVVVNLPQTAQSILELGCGTGALTGMLAARYPDAQVRAVDASAQMIEVAKERLGRLGVPASRVNFEVSLFEELALPSRAFDLVTSNMSLHHVSDKQPVYTRIRDAIVPGGALIFGDELMGATPEVERRHYDTWVAFARQPGHLTEDEFDDIFRHIEQFDHYETLPKQLELLASAGFGPVDCVWRRLNYAVFVSQAAA
jgi:ubiquinone/menaquinone biosynthesis C-methylase UbiE